MVYNSYANIFFEHESHESNESFNLRHDIHSGDYFPLVSGSSTNLVVNLNIRGCFFEHESDESNELFRLLHGIYSWDSGDYFPLVSGSSTNLVVN